MRERRVLVDTARENGMLHYHYFEQGCGCGLLRGQSGTGLLVVSRWPIVDSWFHRYTVRSARRAAPRRASEPCC